jgi:uncharacterized protein YkwD
MRRIWTIGLAALVGGLLTLAPATASASGPWDSLLAPESACPGQSDPTLPPATQEQTMVCMHNWARAQRGLGPMQNDGKLSRSSLKKAKDIRRCQQFSHNACGRNTFYWVQRVGFETGHYGAGENLEYGQGTMATVRGAMSAWLNSSIHRNDLLTPSWKDVGISVVDGRLDGHPAVAIWVAHFGYHGA